MNGGGLDLARRRRHLTRLWCHLATSKMRSTRCCGTQLGCAVLRRYAAAPRCGCLAGSKHGCTADEVTLTTRKKGKKGKKMNIYERSVKTDKKQYRLRNVKHFERNSKRKRKVDSVQYLKNLMLGCFDIIVLFWWRHSSSVSGIELFQIQIRCNFARSLDMRSAIQLQINYYNSMKKNIHSNMTNHAHVVKTWRQNPLKIRSALFKWQFWITSVISW